VELRVRPPAGLPTQWLGFSPHHMDFAGTFLRLHRRYIQLVGETLDSIAQAGFREVFGAECARRNIAEILQALAAFHEKAAGCGGGPW
jgi:hypothetical protein